MSKIIAVLAAFFLTLAISTSPAFAGGDPQTTVNTGSQANSQSNAYGGNTVNNNQAVGMQGDINNTNNSSSNSGALSVNGGNTLVFAPQAGKRTLFPPSMGQLAGAGNLFINPGQSINAQVAELLWHFEDFCGGKVPTSVLRSPRYVPVHDTEGGITVVFHPYTGYVMGMPPSLGQSITVQSTTVSTNLPYYHRYFCVGTLVLATDEDAKAAELKNIPDVLNRARNFVTNNLTGFSDLILVTAPQGIAFANEVEGSGSGFSLGPQGTGFLGSFLAGFAGNYSKAHQKAGIVSHIGAAVLIFARAPDHECSCYAVESVPPKAEPKAQPQVSKNEPQRVVIEIKTPNSK